MGFFLMALERVKKGITLVLAKVDLWCKLGMLRGELGLGRGGLGEPDFAYVGVVRHLGIGEHL